MRRLARGAPWLMLVACSACGGDYWLGGAHLGSPRGSGGTRGMDDAGSLAVDAAGADATPIGRSLDMDFVLRGKESAELVGTTGSECRILGNGHSIRSMGTWTGHLLIKRCTLQGLGSPSAPAIDVEPSGSGDVTIEETTLSTSGAVHVTNDDDSTTTIRNDVIADDSTVSLDESADLSRPSFSADGASTAPKFFQGNRVYRSDVTFESPNWLIGGDTDAESNLLIGLRAGIGIGAPGIVVRGNYVHMIHYQNSGDESAMSSSYGTVDTLAEHNVLRGGVWVLRAFGGELRYNAILDAEFSSWLNQPFEGAKIHHDLFLMCTAPRYELEAGIHLVNYRATGIEVYNNTLDAGGPTMSFHGAAVSVDDGCFLSSLRSNLIYDFPFRRNDGGAAAVRPGYLEGVTPPPGRLSYADYNLFYNPDASMAQNYAVAVQGHTVRVDSGFGQHDAHAGGPVDEQVDPGKLGFSGTCFPFSDTDIEMGKVTVSQMLTAFRQAYAPAASSALLGSGDPADGAGNFIGAIGDGTLPGDRFGTFGR
jgi:hypothetical protein